MSTRIPRFIITKDEHPETFQVHDTISLSGDNLHHLVHVLRRRIGEEVEVVQENETAAFQGKIVEITTEHANVCLEHKIQLPYQPSVNIVVALSKAAVCDFIVEKSVELGATQISFFLANRSQGAFEGTKRLSRFNRVSQAAIKQSGASTNAPKISCFQTLEEALSALHNNKMAPSADEYRLLCIPSGENILNLLKKEPCHLEALSPESTSLSHKIAKKPAKDISLLEHSKKNAESSLIVGPEGGLTSEEIETSLKYGYLASSLGAKVLRTETAALLALSLVLLFRSQDC